MSQIDHCVGYVAKNPIDICFDCKRCISDYKKNVLKMRDIPLSALSNRKALLLNISHFILMKNLGPKELNELIKNGESK